MNAETAALIESSKGWKELKSACEASRLPQSVGVIVPDIMQPAFSEEYGRLILGDGPLWNEGEHPDLISAGTQQKPPSIDECRQLQSELALHPVSSSRRLAVIWAADKLSQEASNCLLKITEEPPAHGSILFMSEEDSLIPTIKSRIWSIHIDLPEEITKAKEPPATPAEWAAWMDVGRKPSPELLCLEMRSWIRSCAQKGDYSSAARLDYLTRVIQQRRLSAAVIEDLVFALFREGVSYEKILGNLW